MSCQESRRAIESRSGREQLPLAVMEHIDIEGCDSCGREAREMASLLALLQAQPKIEVPSDFEFRLKARIARAESMQREESGVAALLGRLWSGSFSWAQATAAMAALALIVSVSSYRMYNTDETVAPGGQIATAAGAETAAGAVVATADAPMALAAAPRTTGRVVRQSQAAALAAPATAVESEADSTAPSWKVFNHQRSQIVTAPQQMTLIGAEGASQSGGRTPAYVPSI